jgi:general secretion pathway protein K
MTGRLKNESGFALILTLVVTALMVAVVVEMIHQVYVDTSLSRSFRDGQQASILAESGATGAKTLLSSNVDNPTVISKLLAAPLKLEDEAGSLEITISDESGKININGLVLANGNDVDEKFTQPVLRRLGTNLQLPGDIWGGVVDWTDKNDSPVTGGAETPYYRSLKPSYSARNDKLLTLTELTLVKGIKPEIFSVLRNHLTIYSDSPMPRVNVNTASEEVLRSLDDRITPSVAKRIIEERGVQAFKTLGDLSRVPELNTVASDQPGRISIKGSVFRITSVTRVKNSGRTVEAVVRLSPPAVLSWQEY